MYRNNFRKLQTYLRVSFGNTGVADVEILYGGREGPVYLTCVDAMTVHEEESHQQQ